MAHRCVHCGKIIEKASDELLKGCSTCGSKFFFYIKDEKISSLKEEKEITSLPEKEKKEMEEEARKILGVEDEEEPVILDLESIRVLGKGKYEIDIISLMNKKPIIIKIQEGKYIIDLF